MDLYDEAYQALSGQRSSVLKKKREPISELAKSIRMEKAAEKKFKKIKYV